VRTAPTWSSRQRPVERHRMQQRQAVPLRQRRSSSGCFRRQLHRHLRPPDGSAYGRVNWSIDVPNGAYSTVKFDFNEELERRLGQHHPFHGHQWQLLQLRRPRILAVVSRLPGSMASPASSIFVTATALTAMISMTELATVCSDRFQECLDFLVSNEELPKCDAIFLPVLPRVYPVFVGVERGHCDTVSPGRLASTTVCHSISTCDIDMDEYVNSTACMESTVQSQVGACVVEHCSNTTLVGGLWIS
jgi:hypothetical protein